MGSPKKLTERVSLDAGTAAEAFLCPNSLLRLNFTLELCRLSKAW